jgi:hypothetical protein
MVNFKEQLRNKKFGCTSQAENKSYYFVHLEQFGIKRIDTYNKIGKIRKFIKMMNCTIEDFEEAVKHLHIQDRSLYEFYVDIRKDVAVDEENNYIYVSNGDVMIKSNKKDDYKVGEARNIYIGAHSHISLQFSEIAKYLIERDFPFLKQPPFSEIGRKYPKEINNLCFDREMSVGDFTHSMNEGIAFIGHELTLGDIFDIMQNKAKMNEKIYVPRYSIYEDEIYIKADETENLGHTIMANLGDFVRKDWEAIENEVTFYYNKKEDGSLEMIKQPQKEHPFFNSPIIKELEQRFTEK